METQKLVTDAVIIFNLVLTTATLIFAMVYHRNYNKSRLKEINDFIKGIL